jgi:hypothetical protein
MKVEHFVLCDEAKNINGRLYPTGIFNRLLSGSVPAIINNKSVALRLSFIPNEDLEGIRNIIISILDADGKTIDTLEDVFIVKYDGYSSITADLSYEMKGVGLTKFGDYIFNLSVNNEHLSSILLSLIQKDKISIPAPNAKMHYYAYHIKMQDLRGGFPGFLSKAPPPPIVDGVMHAVVLDKSKTTEEAMKSQVRLYGELVGRKYSRSFSSEEFEQLHQKHKETLLKNGFVTQAIPNFSRQIRPFSD